MSKSKKELKPSVAKAPSANKEATLDNNQVSLDVQAHLANEIYSRLSTGQPFPGYSLLPSHKAAANPTVDAVLAEYGDMALCKIKSSAETAKVNFTPSTRRGALPLELAKNIEVQGYDYDA